MLNSDEAAALLLWQKQIHLARRPYRETKDALESLTENMSPWHGFGIVSAIAVPVLSHSTAARDRAIALIGLAEWGLALRIYQRENGRYPDSLDQVRKAVRWRLPADVFSGKDFIYSHDGRGYILYSIGPNLRDDKGADETCCPRPPKSGQPAVPEEKIPDDIVWRMSR